MTDEDDLKDTWHTGLHAQLDTSFPKKCVNCGRVFQNADQYFTETMDISEQNRGLKSYDDDDTSTIVEAFRNCPCGSTLMEMFEDHRDELQNENARKQRPEEIARSIRVEDPLAESPPPAPRAKPTHVDELSRPANTVEDELGMEFTEMFADDHGPWSDEWHEGLRPSGDDAFPKKCRNCGRIFDTPDDFFRATVSIREDQTGLRQAIEEDASVFIEAFRNCPCGSTLMDHFADRRDMSEAGQARREKFDDLVVFLVKSGVDSSTARTELLKVVRGGKSEILARIKPPGVKLK